MRTSTLPCLDQFSSGVNVSEIESTTSSTKGVINSERILAFNFEMFMVLFYISGIGANRHEMLIIIMFFMIKAISTSMAAISVSTAKVLKLVMSSQYWWLTA